MNDSSHKAESLGQTGLLLSSASEGNVTRINELLEGGVSMDSCDYDRRTALHLAATEGHSHVVELMLKRGANINPVDRWGDTPLSDARKYAKGAVSKILEQHGARIELHEFSRV